MTHGTRTELACLQAATRDMMARVSLAKQVEDDASDASYKAAFDARYVAEKLLASHVCKQLGVELGELRVLSEMIRYMPDQVEREWMA